MQYPKQTLQFRYAPGTNFRLTLHGVFGLNDACPACGRFKAPMEWTRLVTKPTHMTKKQHSAVIGSGVGGIASAIRLAAKGHQVIVFEQAGRAGGKVSERRQGGFRFDTGPSLFTMPTLVDELFALCGKNSTDYFRYTPLKSSCQYFWDDGTVVNAWLDKAAFAREVETQTAVPAERVLGFLQKSARMYDITADVFLFNSLHKPANFLRPGHRSSMLRLHELDVFTTMHKKNRSWFRDPRIVQLFDRYATYNGSNPYKTPATLNIIPHLEHNTGVYFPEKGMYHIVEALYQLALYMGVVFHFDARVERILLHNTKKVQGLQVAGEKLAFDQIVSDVDVVTLYKNLLPDLPFPKKQLKLERSSSALIFYWGVNHRFPELELHNILFSGNYREEFIHLFDKKTIASDPTVYLFISSRAVPTDAPEGQENWYVMINVPENVGQDWDALITQARRQILEKINRRLDTNLEPHIVRESYADPRTIERDTASYRGSLYGLSSNNKFAAFYRHPNFRKGIRGLYFVGGSVHPGGGIPLCLASAKIVESLINEK